MEEPRRNYRAGTVQADINELNIELNMAKIGSMKTQTFENISRENIMKKGYLISRG